MIWKVVSGTFLCFLATTLHADTILKLGLGPAGADLELTDGILSTVDDLDAGTAGEQNTGIQFTGFLDGMPDITTAQASFSLDSVQLVSTATTVGPSMFVQPTLGGTFHLWDELNQLLLSGSLTDGVISGVVGPAATGSFFSLQLDQFTAGSLLPLLNEDSLTLAISFTSVNGGLGFSVLDSTLQPFQAAGTGSIAALVPEPNACGIAVLGVVGLLLRRRRRTHYSAA